MLPSCKDEIATGALQDSQLLMKCASDFVLLIRFLLVCFVLLYLCNVLFTCNLTESTFQGATHKILEFNQECTNTYTEELVVHSCTYKYILVHTKGLADVLK